MVLIKGAGDLATGIAYRLKKSGFDVVMTEIHKPTTVRRTVAFSQAVFDNEIVIEGIKGVKVNNINEIYEEIREGNIPIIIDEKAEIIKELRPNVVVDAIIAKKNLGTSIEDAPIVIGVGPGFEAKVDCHLVVETKRGHYLGKVIEEGSAIPNTGVPGNIGGYTRERIIRASSNGKIKPLVAIGDFVKKGDIVAYIDGIEVLAEIDGIVRGMLQEGIEVFKGMKSGDIDPRCEKDHCFTISDKARSIGGGVLEAIMYMSNNNLNLK
ncbi:selenium-dependent molybdenum cofactor biosynthesis protein YqeB [uncultured Clostridium sp.]|uniref:selenium-dependent molybdenum cofactor biosynthesis protein YqeB n=1 Tax=uncultured Clostridium sp. TaxID=59620 RepID=UPI0025D20E04|nr:selenium-dependent molybdenum cofactor biosynthesis protein YqeB [uncultured Clostridium sp.]MDU4883862.1 selenium-dependent molybdenum cofactor biosynthesis protein YqeB [Clostridium celatum]MDU7077105.1 selenium-dependent molybdenum cofactor biosynthesis protein YqeB [Clostridium celatum]